LRLIECRPLSPLIADIPSVYHSARKATMGSTFVARRAGK
jgi:hypothetical protein